MTNTERFHLLAHLILFFILPLVFFSYVPRITVCEVTPQSTSRSWVEKKKYAPFHCQHWLCIHWNSTDKNNMERWTWKLNIPDRYVLTRSLKNPRPNSNSLQDTHIWCSKKESLKPKSHEASECNRKIIFSKHMIKDFKLDSPRYIVSFIERSYQLRFHPVFKLKTKGNTLCFVAHQ